MTNLRSYYNMTAGLHDDCMSATVYNDGDTTYNMHTQELVTSSTISTIPLVYYYVFAASVVLPVTCLGLVALILCVCIILCKQHRKKFFHTPIESESEQQDVQCHMSKNIVYEAIIKNNHSHNFTLNDNVAYSSSAANTTTSDYEYVM